MREELIGSDRAAPAHAAPAATKNHRHTGAGSPVSAPLIVASDIVAAVKEYPSNGFETESLLPVNAI